MKIGFLSYCPRIVSINRNPFFFPVRLSLFCEFAYYIFVDLENSLILLEVVL